MSDPYAVLGLPRNAPIEDVKKAYRRLVLQWHPGALRSAECIIECA